MSLIQPILANDDLLADIAAARDDQRAFHLWWLGQSGFLIQWLGRHLLLDPYLSDSLTAKYEGTDKPHIRMTERCVRPERLDFVDVVTSSHNHTDHLDAETLRPLMNVNPNIAIIVPAANQAFAAQRLGCPPSRLTPIDAGESREVAGFSVTALPSAHDVLEQDDVGHHKYLGYVVRFGPFTVYHSGDTRLYEGLAETLKPFQVDVALLPINGAAPERRVAGNLDGREAAGLAKAIGARLAIPCHYDMFTFNTASPGLFVAEAARLGQRVRVLQCGERWSSSSLD